MQNESTGSFANKHNNSSHYFIFVILPSLTPLKITNQHRKHSIHKCSKNSLINDKIMKQQSSYTEISMALFT